MTKDMCGVCVCVLNNRCCLSSLTLTFCFLVMPWSCGWPFVVTHTFCSFESASRLLHCMHFVDCIISLMSQVPIFSHGLFKKHGVWSRVFPRKDIISARRHILLLIYQHLKLPCFSSTRSLLSNFYPPSFFNRCYVQKASNKYTKFFTKCCQRHSSPQKPAPSSQVVLLPIFVGVGFNTVAPKICKAQKCSRKYNHEKSSSTVMAKVDPLETSLQGGPLTSYKCYNLWLL